MNDECCECGLNDDVTFCECGDGPFCSSCWSDHEAVCVFAQATDKDEEEEEED